MTNFLHIYNLENQEQIKSSYQVDSNIVNIIRYVNFACLTAVFLIQFLARPTIKSMDDGEDFIPNNQDYISVVNEGGNETFKNFIDNEEIKEKDDKKDCFESNEILIEKTDKKDKDKNNRNTKEISDKRAVSESLEDDLLLKDPPSPLNFLTVWALILVTIYEIIVTFCVNIQNPEHMLTKVLIRFHYTMYALQGFVVLSYFSLLWIVVRRYLTGLTC